MLIDTHAHLIHKRLSSDLPRVFQEASQAGVEQIILAVGSVDDSHAALAIARKHSTPALKLTTQAGVHPHEAADAAPHYLTDIETILADEQCVALGEIGLDYHYDFSPRDIQQRIFAQQLDLAARLGCPVVLHTREAFDDTIALLENSNVAGEKLIFHSFTGSAQQARLVLDRGATISYSGIVTFKNSADLREAALITPADRILVETDSPFLSPEPLRKVKTNHPALVVHVAKKLADLRNVSLETFAQQTTENAKRLFGLPV